MGRLAYLVTILIPALGLLGSFLFVTGCDGLADSPSQGVFLGDSIVGPGDGSSDGGSRSDLDPGQLYVVTKIVEASSDIPSWTNSDLPFNTTRRQLGTVATDSQWPFEFIYTYPPNNYALTEAHMFVVTSRDSSDTEGLFFEGIFTGRPPGSMVSTTSTKVTDRLYACQQSACNGGIAPTGPANSYFLDWALTHYKVSTDNTFDINLESLLIGT